MKISEHTIKLLARAVCGDAIYTPYIKGHELVQYFNTFGFNEVYEQGFPSRWKYTEDKLRNLNGKDAIRRIIEDTVDPRRFHEAKLKVEDAVTKINDFIKYDKYELRLSGEYYKLFMISGEIVEATTAKGIDHEFINEQIGKCQKKIREGDFNGAITNARSLIEAVFIEIIERQEKKEVKNDGNMDNLWSQVKKIMKLEFEKKSMPDFIFQILAGIDTAVKGLAGLSNNAGDRHANKFNTKRHHAKLAVNLSMTIADFILDSWNFQKNKDNV